MVKFFKAYYNTLFRIFPKTEYDAENLEKVIFVIDNIQSCRLAKYTHVHVSRCICPLNTF